MKGVITAAGLGTRSGLDGRLRKEMLPVYLKIDGRIVLRPMIEYIWLRMKSLGIEEVCTVLNPNDTLTISYVKENMPDVAILHQVDQRGFGDAVLKAAEFVGESAFLLNAGDGVILRKELIEDGIRLYTKSVSQVLYLMQVENPSRYGVAQLSGDEEHSVVAVEEKPRKPKSNLALCATYILKPEIFGFLDDIDDEKVELTPAIASCISTGIRTLSIEIKRTDWISFGTAEEYGNMLAVSLEAAKSSP